ncbi:hypothetical protein PR003_g1041 [Phytophthora rubi]|uniref:Uncharacterized protein n=1 Tax=Phytophthora rubi TaxID=129364 RepID=A0A6A4G679_9STRA|nr:hypothetical protein PR002_g965 [Phytophthora rubi]KAE9358908.1 hypothetical protein PR003_g1041 [Phytophthora rubi]
MQANAPNCAVKTDSHDPARGQSADGDEIPSLAKVKAIETYVYPKANYLLRHVRAYKTQLESINSALARDLRHLFHLNQSSTTAFHTPVRKGWWACVVSHAWRMLHSRTRLSARLWRNKCGRSFRSEPRPLVWLRAGCHPERQKRKSGDIGSLWADVKHHLAARGLKLTTESVRTESGTEVDMMMQLKVPHRPQPLTHKDVTHQLRQHWFAGWWPA